MTTWLIFFWRKLSGQASAAVTPAPIIYFAGTLNDPLEMSGQLTPPMRYSGILNDPLVMEGTMR